MWADSCFLSQWFIGKVRIWFTDILAILESGCITQQLGLEIFLRFMYGWLF